MGFQKYEFFQVEPLWNNWAASRIDREIVLQMKFDGMRFQIHKDGNKVKIITEDRRRDRAFIFKRSVEELLKKVKVDNFIIDTEQVEYDPNIELKKSPRIWERYEAKPREDMIPWVTVTRPEEVEKLDDLFVVFHVHDCLYYNGEDIHLKPYVERLEYLAKIFPKPLTHWVRAESVIVDNKKDFEREVHRMRNIPGSEGCMLKEKNSIYKLSGRTREWCIPEGETVLANPEPIEIQDLKEGDLLLNSRVEEKIDEYYCGEIITIQPALLPSFRLTPEHKVLAIKPHRYPCGAVDPGSIWFKLPEPAWYRASELEDRDYVLIEKWNPIVVDSNFNREQFKFFGWYVAEGYTEHNRIRIGLGKEGYNEIEELKNIALTFTDKITVEHRKKDHRLTLKDPELARIFDEWFGNGAEKKRIPSFILQAPSDKVLSFLKGYIAGDGNRHKNGIQAMTTSKVLAYQLLLLTLRLDDIPMLRNYGENWNLFWSGRRFLTLFNYTFNRPAHRKVRDLGRYFGLPIRISKEDYSGKIYHIQTDTSYFHVPCIVSNSKLKNCKEIDVMVWDTHKVKGTDAYVYTCLVGPISSQEKSKYREKDVVSFRDKLYVKIGDTYNTSIKANRGDIITVTPVRIRKYKTKDNRIIMTWMFPAVDPIGVRDKKEPDPISTVEKIIAAKTGTLSRDVITIKLLPCPFWLDDDICPLKEAFQLPEGLTEIEVEYLKYPVDCQLANFYRCRYVKPYYYGIKRVELSEEEIDSFEEEQDEY